MHSFIKFSIIRRRATFPHIGKRRCCSFKVNLMGHAIDKNKHVLSHGRSDLFYKWTYCRLSPTAEVIFGTGSSGGVRCHRWQMSCFSKTNILLFKFVIVKFHLSKASLNVSLDLFGEIDVSCWTFYFPKSH